MESDEGKHVCTRCRSKFNTQIGLDQHMAFGHGMELSSEIQRLSEQIKELKGIKKELKRMRVKKELEGIKIENVVNLIDELNQRKKFLKKLTSFTFKFVRNYEKKRNAIRATLRTSET